jgi:DNA-3-methyladenine glycosylase II
VTGLPPLRRAEPGFAGLLHIVTEQQVSLASAAAIWGRMVEQLQPMTPEHLATLSDEALRAPGLSMPKIRTIRALCEALASGVLDLDHVARAPNEHAFEALTAIKGIGPWTAEIYLLSCLGRRDVWPAGDLALQVAAQAAFALDARPDAKAMRAMAEPWRPWRAIAARVLWSYYRAVKGLPPAV